MNELNHFPNRLMSDGRQNRKVALGTSVSEDGKLSVTEFSDGSFTLEWDENDPALSILSEWTEADFIDCLTKACEEIL